jgi:hypothetical protein
LGWGEARGAEGVLAEWEGGILQEEVEGTIWPLPRSCIATLNANDLSRVSFLGELYIGTRWINIDAMSLSCLVDSFLLREWRSNMLNRPGKSQFAISAVHTNCRIVLV